MVDALISPLLEQITTLAFQQLQQQVKLVVGVEKDVEKLTSNLVAIQAILEDAERRQLKDVAVKNWLDKLKAVSYDMDDVLDEWSTALLQWQMKEETENDALATKKKMVCSFLHCSPCFCFRKVIQHRDIAIKIKELSGRLDLIAKEKSMFGFEFFKAIDETQRLRSTSFVDASKVHGRDDEKKDIIRKLLGQSRSNVAGEIDVISIVGMGGIGKTTLAQLAYNDDEVKAHFEKRVWVCVSDPFDEIRIAKAILEALNGVSPNLVELQSLVQSISESIEGRKILLVLDDVWTEDFRKWEPLKHSLKCSAPGSRILVTTRKDSVANMVETTYLIHLARLSKNECWLIFSQLSFYKRSRDECENLMELGQKIADKCKGLPLAAKTLGGLMQSKRSREEWENVFSSELWELEQVESSLFPPLLLSYYDLPIAIRQCFTFCTMFPKDYSMEECELIKMWMAQGYLKAPPSRDMELVGKEYFEILAARAFFQDFRDVWPYTKEFKMHDIVHDFGRFFMKNECWTMDVNDFGESWVDSSYEKVRHSSVMLSEKAPFPVSICKAKNLRSLLLINENFSNAAVPLLDLFQRLTCLRSLTLIDSPIKEIPSEVGNLIHLRHLNLARCWGFSALPETLCNLGNLQSLDLFLCRSLRRLPQGMGKLTKLRHLRIDSTWIAFMPKGVERLSSLRTLSNFIVCIDGGNEGDAATLGELRNLNHLGGYLQIDKLRNVANVDDAVKAELKSKRHLSHLVLNFFGWRTGILIDEDALIEALEPPSDIENLRILDYRGTMLPSWLMSLTKLKRLEFLDCGTFEVLPPLGRLPWLEKLKVAFDTRRLDVGFLGLETVGQANKPRKDEVEKLSVTGFPKLKKLQLWGMETLEEWDGIGSRVEEKGTSMIMPQLRCLKIWRCPKLKALPDYVLAAPLEKLSIVSCSILEECYKKGTGENWHKISHITDTRVGVGHGNKRK